MDVHYSAKFEGKCDVCEKKGVVQKWVDKETMTSATICQKCVMKGEITDPAEFIKKYGKKDEDVLKPAVRYEKGAVAG
ncbi:MAG: hypothetical protein HY833_01645 [Candidatus Aenigmarchaeota archaeon]|nr:hypothetical protein [Candidatus Aenigmarchaeota archaeon]